MSLYTNYVRTNLEYAVHAWCPRTLCDKESLENVQRRAVAMVTNLRGKTYVERLAEMGMTTLENRRRRGDLIQMFRVMAGKDRVEPSTWFLPSQNREGAMSTRLTSGCLNVERKHGRTEVRKTFGQLGLLTLGTLCQTQLSHHHQLTYSRTVLTT